jgi:hypothetical protein
MQLSTVGERFKKYLSNKYLFFRTLTGDQFDASLMYIKQFFNTGKTERNMEKMMAAFEQADYHRIQHFISESLWDYRTVFDDAAKDCSQFLFGLGKVGLLIDESGFKLKAQPT